MSIFRSEDMYLYKIVLVKDNEKAIANILGSRNIAHFINLNEHEQVFNLPYVDLIKRCDDAERRLVYLIAKCQQFNIKLRPAQSPEELSHLISEIALSRGKSKDLLFDEIERDIQRAEEFVKQQLERASQMNEECNNLIEHYNVVKRTGRMIYGEELIDKAFKKHDVPEEIKGNSSDELIAEFRPKGSKSRF